MVPQLTLGSTRTRKCHIKWQYGHHRFRQLLSDNLKGLLWSNCLQRNLFISRIEEQQCYRLLITSFVLNINKRPSDHIVVAGLSVCYCIQMIIAVDLNVALGSVSCYLKSLRFTNNCRILTRPLNKHVITIYACLFVYI